MTNGEKVTIKTYNSTEAKVPHETNSLVQQEKRNIWDYWAMPNDAPRDSQRTALDWMADLPPEKKYILCQIPVGGGKSPIALTYAGFLGHGTLGSSYILTPQRVLQKQYEESFADQPLVSVYGKANYMCETKRGLNCDMGSDIKPKCPSCPYRDAFEQMECTPHVVLNYKLALLYSELFPSEDSFFPIKDLMVFDECHTLENHLVNHRAVKISKKRCESMKIMLLKPFNLNDAHEWLKSTYYDGLHELYFKLDASVKEIDLKYEFQKGGHLPSELKTKKDYKEIKRHRVLVKSLSERNFDEIEEKYVLVQEDNGFIFKEIYGANLFNVILKPKANRFLFMSSTILNFEEYAKDIGLPPEETAIISLESEFDIENRPVYFMPTAKMTYGWNKPDKVDLRKKMSDQVIKLAEIHSQDSGVIHTGSFQIAKWLIGEIKDKVSHTIITHDQDDNLSRDECIEEFTKNNGEEPMILISPSVTEGLDLKDDISRFAMFVKVPYPFLGDAWIKRRLDLSDEWYKRQAMIAIIQGGGRIVRSEDDWGNVYILDESFSYLWYKFKSKAPKWWKEAFIKTKI